MALKTPNENSSPTTYAYAYYQNDHLGTPQQLVQTSGQIVWQGEYDLFGKVNETINTLNNPLRFPGQYQDHETGLYYNWNRYYSAEIGRYITSDPIGLSGGMNTFGYVKQASINLIDPEGLVYGYGNGPYGPHYAAPDLSICGFKLAQVMFAKYGGVDDHLMHCEWQCRMKTECNYSGFVTGFLGYVKEVIDPARTGWRAVRTDPRRLINLPLLWVSDDISLPSWRDILNNEQGRRCADQGGCYPSGGQCEQCCKNNPHLRPDPNQ